MRQAAPERAGKSLIEVVVVIALLGAVMVPTVRMIHGLMRSEREGARSLALSTSAARLSREFRRDVHSAVETEIVSPNAGRPEELRLTQSDGETVVYAATDGGIERLVKSERDGDSNVLSRERYRLPAGRTRFETSAESPMVALIHERASADELASAPGRSGMKVLRIEAIAGRDHRFAR